MTAREIFGSWPAIVVGVLAGVVLVPLSDIGADGVRASFDQQNPVVVASGEIVDRGEDWVEIAITGEKNRQCAYVALAAYSMAPDGLLRDGFVARTDRPTSGATRPLGMQEFGTWRVWPVRGAVSVEMWVTHQCEGRLVRSKLADIDLK